MKKVVLAIASTVIFIAAAHAAQQGVSTGQWSAENRVDACQGAKGGANLNAPAGTVVVGYSPCDCSYDRGMNLWTCSVDGYWRSE